jgi:hypothetical protein
MNAIVKAELAALPIPVEDGRHVRCMVIRRDAQWRTAWGMDGCRRPEVFGPAYESSREAIAASRYINGEAS